ncbi:condensation domain-containing protein [Vreelandella neptunia]
MEGAERALGMFINTLPIRIRLGTKSVADGLSETHNELAELLHHEHVNLGLAQRCSALPGGAPLFTSLLNYRYSSPQQEGGTPLIAGKALGNRGRTNYPVVMSVDDLGEGGGAKVSLPGLALRLFN